MLYSWHCWHSTGGSPESGYRRYRVKRSGDPTNPPRQNKNLKQVPVRPRCDLVNTIKMKPSITTWTPSSCRNTTHSVVNLTAARSLKESSPGSWILTSIQYLHCACSLLAGANWLALTHTEVSPQHHSSGPMPKYAVWILAKPSAMSFNE